MTLHASIKVFGRIGDRDPLNDGGAILDHGDGRPQLVYLISDPDSADAYGEPTRFWRYTCDLLEIEDDATGAHAWIDADAVAQSCGMDGAEYRRLCAGTWPERALAIVNAAGFYGWENFDSYPVVMNHAQAQAWDDSLTERETLFPGGKVRQ